MHFVRSVAGVTLRDQKRSEDIIQKLEINNISDYKINGRVIMKGQKKIISD
jgi:hypothetical protein